MKESSSYPRSEWISSLLFNFQGPTLKRYGGIAQLGEHLLCKQGVSGSIPLISTKGLSNRSTKPEKMGL